VLNKEGSFKVNSWLETIAVTIIALAGAFIGRAFANLRKPWWFFGYIVPLLLITILAAARFDLPLCFAFRWLTAGRIKFIVLPLSATIGLTAILPKVRFKLEKLLVCLVMGVAVIWFSILPFLTPALIKDRLQNIKTITDSEGSCFQTTDYTCGPAAAVTALRKLGLDAQEGELAILARSSPISGTLPLSLSSALKSRYAADGLECDYSYFDSIDQLKNAGFILVPVKNGLFSDHCVTILDVSDHTVTFADPVLGKRSMTHEQFEKIWRFSGITLTRKSPHDT
jgi:predicted double-glycine peptidase